jgi:hypothetical protein
MKLFPKKYYQFESLLDQQELDQRLNTTLKKSTNLVSSYIGKPFTGYKEGNIYRIVSSTPGFGAISVCELNLTLEKNSIRALFRVNNGFKVLFFFWLIGASCGLGVLLVSIDIWMTRLLLIFIVFPICVFLFIKMIGLYERVSREFLIRKLEKYLDLKPMS